ncbi:MAG: hypothetical protein IKU90_00675 [Clostridia bacterium]|nr:hypothetical protein [Clostridia bacterium]
MEKLMLTCGRFMPPHGGDTEQRVERLEAYLSKLTQELELVLRELNDAAAEQAVASLSGEEASV